MNTQNTQNTRKRLKPTQKNTIFIIAIIIFALIIGFFRGKSQLNTDTPQTTISLNLKTGTAFPTPKDLPNFTLLSTNHTTFTLDNFKNQWSFVFFGYTHCPDICPQSLIWLKAISETVSPGNPVQYIFMSIDPRRDSIQQLQHFLEQPRFASLNKNAAFIGVTGNKQEIIGLAKSMGLFASDNATTSENYTLDHSGALVLINPDGQLTALFTRPDDAKAVAEDFLTIVQKSQDKHAGIKPYVSHD